VYLEGVPAGVKAGGVLEQIVHNIEVECLPRNIPEKIAIDVSALDMNQALYVKDIPVNPDVKLLLDPEEIVCHVTHVKEEPVAAPAEGEAAEAAAPAEGEAAADAEKK
ncbi:MAG: 50S ribosomal protein L25, partial [Spirochaetia bacterium]|nr:50S ribosomal protein L25 [Spirochaetia bacterium]